MITNDERRRIINIHIASKFESYRIVGVGMYRDGGTIWLQRTGDLPEICMSHTDQNLYIGMPRTGNLIKSKVELDYLKMRIEEYEQSFEYKINMLNKVKKVIN